MTTTIVKVILADGNSWMTRINLDPAGATEYYLGKTWKPGRTDPPSICVTVEILAD